MNYELLESATHNLDECKAKKGRGKTHVRENVPTFSFVYLYLI